MPISLNAVEARILGSLIEKSLTTPESYPLSLNSVVLACNQKSSRDPVMNLDETTVARAIYGLQEKGLIQQKSEVGSRVAKFAHRAENLLPNATPQEIGALTVLLLRGPQTPGEIRSRVGRLCEFTSVAEVELLFQSLANRPDGPYVAKLPRHAGFKEARYTQLFSADAPQADTMVSPAMPASPPAAQGADRLTVLEQRVAALETTLRDLQDRLRGLVK